MTADRFEQIAALTIALIGALLVIGWVRLGQRLRRPGAVVAALVLTALVIAGMVPAVRLLAPDPRDAFVQVRGDQFVRDGRPIRLVGANANHIWETAQFSPEKILAEGTAVGIGVIRIMPYAEQYYPFDRTPEDTKTVERYWQSLDAVIDLAGRRGIVVILAPTWDYVGLIAFGDARRGNEGHYRFTTDPALIEKYEQFWTYVATRRNTVNGKLYRDDPTILGYNVINEWEVADHPAGRDSPENRYDVTAWYDRVSTHIKRQAPNQLVTTGMIGDTQPGSDFVLQHLLPNIDFITVHAYEDQRPPEWLADRARLARTLIRKPIVLQEGMARGGDDAKAAYIRRYWDVALASGYNGVMFWDWQTSTDGYQVYPEYEQTVRAIREYAAKFNATK